MLPTRIFHNIGRRNVVQAIFHKRCMSFLKAHRKRFYRNANICESEGGYFIQLDGKTIKTPLRNALCVPKETLALAIANEWHMQSSDINTTTMPLTTICNTVIDNPTNIPKSELILEMLQFLHTDTICSIADTPESLVDFQNENWTPIRDWFSQKFDVTLNASADLFDLSQNDETIDTMGSYLFGMNKWQLNGLQASIDAIKSFILPVAVLNERITVEEAVFLSRLEQEYQIKQWGNFEGAHDIEMYNQQTSVAAGTLLCQLCRDVEDP